MSASDVNSSNPHSPGGYESFFEYTVGRFIHDEAKQLALRRISFDIAALMNVAVTACGAQRVLSMKKVEEGNYNKGFLLLLDNGKEVIARVPTPAASPAHVASEIATMDYVNSRMGIPAPSVLAWSADVDGNSVGAPYMITEKEPGERLSVFWDDLSLELKTAAVTEWVRLEKRMTEANFSGGYGSIFYKGDPRAPFSLDLYTGDTKEERFVLGLDMDMCFWDDNWQKLDDYISGISNHQRAWLEKCAIPAPEIGPLTPPVQDFKSHLQILDQFDAVAPFLIPEEPLFQRPLLLHRNMNSGNIFVSEEALRAGRIEIVSVINWHHTSALPSFYTARVPLFARDFGYLEPDEVQLEDTADDSEKARLQKAFFRATRAINPEYFKAFEWPLAQLIMQPLMLVHSGHWEKNFVSLYHRLFTLQDNWEVLDSNVECPLQFSEDDVEALVGIYKNQQDMHKAVAGAIGVDSSGEVPTVIYEAVNEQNESMKNNLAGELASAGFADRELVLRTWPWQP